ncbi:hypothetical protein ACC684_28620 [Rhizobium ruizarguesonis]
MSKIISGPRNGYILDAATDAQKDAVVDFMKSINGRSKAHVITEFWEFEKLAKMAEGYLDHAKVSKKDRVGCTADYADAGPDTKSYDYAMTVSDVYLRRYAEGWRLMGARKIDVRHGFKGGINVHIPARYIEALKVEAVRNATAGLSPLPTRKPKPEKAFDAIDIAPVAGSHPAIVKFDHLTRTDREVHLMSHNVLFTLAGEGQ